MSCLALSLQPVNGSDILLQTREWFPPPTRALAALSAFRQTREIFAATKRLHTHQAHQSQPSVSPSVDHDAALESIASLGDDPLAASSGQLIVGVESRYRVVYRLVNSIYVLGITNADHDNSINVFDCINTVNQAVSVIVTACRGVDVTPEKLNPLDIVLRGVSSIRLAAMLGSMHGDGIAKMVHSALDTESKIRGADHWSSVEIHSLEHLAAVDSFSNARFEVPAETIAAGDEVAATLVVQTANEQEKDKELEKSEESNVEKDPFAASEVVNKEEELVVAGLEVTTLPPAEATQSTHINVEGFEGEYGGIEFSNDKATMEETFEGFTEAWGGGLDASEFIGPKKIAKKEGLSGLELLQTGPDAPIVEQISAEFRESLLARTGLMGVVYLRTLPKKTSGDDKETEFSFRFDGTSGVKRFVMQLHLMSQFPF
ncbi:hypothetical protein Patl1_14271 [Pistacia atlantica]|uniref:Uncharacterized protein n=1 Tax=Pistacia atlantica TaxID=434234 RepID=A0ACC1ASC4_9ROSI|nr:hypothetical protein Patl1_14271 [Pistacia atlantica]